MSVPTRVEEELYDAAKASGKINSRSAAQQIAHWAKIGRAVESSGTVTQREIESVLTGDLSYDEVSIAAQEVVHAEWMRQIPRRIAQLNFAEEFAAAGEHSWTVGDGGGNAAQRAPDDYQVSEDSAA